MKFLGLAANLRGLDIFRQLFVWGGKKDWESLRDFLAKHYGVEKNQVSGYGNGRSGLFSVILALREKIPEGSLVAVNGMTCKAVVQAVEAAGCVPVFCEVDLVTMHFGGRELMKMVEKYGKIAAVVVQNSFGVAADMGEIEKIAKKEGMVIIEDLAHGVGGFYADGREFGMVGEGVLMSFGKGKSVDVMSGGVGMVRGDGARFFDENGIFLIDMKKNGGKQRRGRIFKAFLDRIYGVIGLVVRGLMSFRLKKMAKVVLAGCLKLGLIEKSADGKVDAGVRLGFWQARILRKRITERRFFRKAPIREFYFVNNRDEVLKELEREGFYGWDFWYEVPVAPKRYFHKVNYPEKGLEKAKWAALHIINLPSWYNDREMGKFREMIKQNEIKWEEK